MGDWTDNIARLCAGNSRLVFSICAAFASVLLGLDRDENGGFHLVGASSIGKSLALEIAASVFGCTDFKRQWNATINGLEATASAHSGVLLILDEMSQCDPRIVGETAYLLANGMGKQRAKKDGNAKVRSSWVVLFLSSGEIALAQHLREAGKMVRAGQEARILNIPADAEKGHGIFEELHGYENGEALHKILRSHIKVYHSTAGTAFIEKLCSIFDDAPQMIRQHKREFLEACLPKDASGQAHRAAERFALCAAAGEMATSFGITGWAKGEATKAVADCFKAWLSHRGGVGNQEVAAILAQVRAFFEKHHARFTLWSLHPNGENTVHDAALNRAGFRKFKIDGDEDFFVLPEIFRNEICAGFDHRMVTKLLIEEGILKPDANNRSSRSISLPGMRKGRAYHIDGSKVWDEEHEKHPQSNANYNEFFEEKRNANNDLFGFETPGHQEHLKNGKADDDTSKII